MSRCYNQFTVCVKGNRKFEYCVDVTHGCVGAKIIPGGCYESCFSLKMARMAGVNFAETVHGTFDESKLVKQLTSAKKHQDFIRVGITGDPAENWPLTLKVVGACKKVGITPVVTTKAWGGIDDTTIKNLVEDGACLHVSLSGLDTEHMCNMRTDVIRRYKAAGGQVVMRVISAPFNHDNEYARRQKHLLGWAQDNGVPILETPLRTFKTVSYWNQLDKSKMKRHISAFSGKADNQMTAGFMLTCNPMNQCDKCSTCINKCRPTI